VLSKSTRKSPPGVLCDNVNEYRLRPSDHGRAVCIFHIVKSIRFIVVHSLGTFENAIDLSGPFRCSFTNSNDVVIA
jgi:hypothetical protein